MEHATIIEMPGGYVRITPDEGYILLNIISDKRYAEAVVLKEDQKNFVAVEK